MIDPKLPELCRDDIGHICTCGSRYLCEVCSPRRSELRAALELSLRRTDNVVVLADRRKG